MILAATYQIFFSLQFSFIWSLGLKSWFNMFCKRKNPFSSESIFFSWTAFPHTSLPDEDLISLPLQVLHLSEGCLLIKDLLWFGSFIIICLNVIVCTLNWLPPYNLIICSGTEWISSSIASGHCCKHSVAFDKDSHDKRIYNKGKINFS